MSVPERRRAAGAAPRMAAAAAAPRMAAAVAAAIVAMALAGCSDGGGSAVATTTGDSVDLDLPGAPEVNVTLAGLEGPDVDLASYRGRPLVVNFFASTCVPCVREMPAFERVNQAAGGAVAFVGVAVNDRPDDALALARETGVTWDLAADPSGRYLVQVGGVGLPTTLVADADGNVIDVHTGEHDEDDLIALLAEAGVEVAL